MRENDDFVFIIRAHILIELLLAQLIALKFPNADALYPKGFERRVIALSKERVINDDVRDALIGVNWLRNHSAHPPSNLLVTDKIADRVMA